MKDRGQNIHKVVSLHEQCMTFNKLDFFSGRSILPNFALSCAKYTRLEAKQGILSHLMLHWHWIPCCSSSHTWGYSTGTPLLPSTPGHTLIKKTSSALLLPLPSAWTTEEAPQPRANNMQLLCLACPEDQPCTLVPEAAAHCKSIMFPVARWMGIVPATSCNPFVMPIAGCYEDVH